MSPLRAEIAVTPLTALAMPARKLRHRKADRIRSHADRIEEHRFDPPILALRSGEIIFGEDTAEAYRLLERSEVPVIYVDDLPPEQVAALRLWLEHHHVEGDWDLDAVKAEFELICELDPQWLDATHWDMRTSTWPCNSAQRRPVTMAMTKRSPSPTTRSSPARVMSGSGPRGTG